MALTSAVVDEVLAANEAYAGDFDKGHLPMPLGRKFAVVTCMDARIETGGALGSRRVTHT